MNKIDILDKFVPLIDIAKRKEKYKDVDTVIITGGRNSFKSFHVALIIVINLFYYNWKILFSRYTWASAKDSIIEEVIEKIGILKLDKYLKQLTGRIIKIDNKEYDEDNLDNAIIPQIVFKGIKTSSGNQTANLKSLKGFNCFIVDEGEEQPSFKDWRKVKRSLRRKDLPNLAIIILNPTPKTHWIYNEFFKKKGITEGFNGVHENICYIHSKYTDKLEWVTPENIKDFEKSKTEYTHQEITDYTNDKSVIYKDGGFYKNDKLLFSKEYEHSIMGGFSDRAEGVIYRNWKYGKFDDTLPFVTGLDFGVIDPDAMVKVAVDKKLKKLYIKQLLYKNGLSTAQLIELIKAKVSKKDLIIADSSATRTIEDIKNANFNIKASTKGPGSIVAGIKRILEYEIILDEESTEIATELNNYTWSDKKAELPIDAYNHSLDAVRYACEKLLNTKKKIRSYSNLSI